MSIDSKNTVQLANKEDIEEIDHKLGSFNQDMLKFSGESEKQLSYVIRSGEDLVAGISACIDWGFILHIELLFVDEHYRDQGIGKFLVDKVETEAKIYGAGMAQTDTFDFQAKGFYLKQGYVIFGELENSPRPGHKRYYLKKILT